MYCKILPATLLTKGAPFAPRPTPLGTPASPGGACRDHVPVVYRGMGTAAKFSPATTNLLVYVAEIR